MDENKFIIIIILNCIANIVKNVKTKCNLARRLSI